MNKKATLDITIIISCVTGMALSYVYLDNIERIASLTLLGIVGAVFLLLMITDINHTHRRKERHDTGKPGFQKSCFWGKTTI